MTNSLWVFSSIALCLQWIVVYFSGISPSPEWQALSAGLAIFGASFMLSWAAELGVKPMMDCAEAVVQTGMAQIEMVIRAKIAI